jgi:hypothetical protein
MNHRFLFPRQIEGRSSARGARERSSEGPSSSWSPCTAMPEATIIPPSAAPIAIHGTICWDLQVGDRSFGTHLTALKKSAMPLTVAQCKM